MKVSTNWLKDFITFKPPLESVAERLTLAGLEVNAVRPAGQSKDTVFDIEITSNRPDWLSHIGVAREIAAVENAPFKNARFPETVNRSMPQGWQLKLRETEGCAYYTACYLEGLQAEPTPAFMAERLEACGLRSVNLIVDITNYVLMEYGQPLHAFDADLLTGKEIQIRCAKDNEMFEAINGKTLKLSKDDLVICDQKLPIALAGVMGGKTSEVHNMTKNIILESAYFHSRWVRKMSQAHGISSESSYRFERKIDPEGVDQARERAIQLLIKYAKPRFVSGVLRAGHKPSSGKLRISLMMKEIESRLGVPIKQSSAAAILSRLGADVKKDSNESLSVKVPSFREDLKRPIDLIEEIARIYGYDNIPETLPNSVPEVLNEHPLVLAESRSHALMTGLGFYETVTFSLVSSQGIDFETLFPQNIKVINPQNKELCYLRPTLLPSLLTVAGNNVRHGAQGGAFYEIANVYFAGQGAKPAPKEERRLGIIAFGAWRGHNWKDDKRDASFYDLKGAVKAYLQGFCKASFDYQKGEFPLLDPEMNEMIRFGKNEIGWFGKVDKNLIKAWNLDLDIFYAELSLQTLSLTPEPKAAFMSLAKYPPIERDLSITVEEAIKAGDVREQIFRHGGELLIDVKIFDVFRGGRIPKGLKNLAFRLTYQSQEKTLVSEDIQKIHADIAALLAENFKATFQ